MKQILLHIGTGKTGTRSIQAALTRMRRQDQLGGVAYPDVGGRRDHALLTFPYKPFERLGRGLRSMVDHDRDRARAMGETMHATFDQILARHDRVLLSTEFFENIEPDGVDRLLHDLHRHGFDRVGVLVYVRDPAGLYVSRMQQQIRASSTIVQPRSFRFGYRRRLEPWDRPDVELTVRAFDRSRLAGGDVVDDCLSAVEAFFDVELPRTPSTTRNLSMSSEAMILLQRYRLHVHPDADDRVRADSSRLVDLVEELHADAATTSPRLVAWAVDRILHANREDLAWLRERHGLDLGRDHPERLRTDEPEVVRIEDVLAGWRPEVLEALTQHVLARLLGHQAPAAGGGSS